MKVFRATQRVVTIALINCLMLLWSERALAQVKLEYKFPEGTKLTYRIKSKTRQALTSMGNENVSDEDTTTVASRTIGKRRSDSSLPVKEKIESLRAVLSLTGGVNVSFNSSDHSFKTNDPQLAFLGDEFKLISESAYTVMLGDKNKVKAIEGSEELLARAAKLDQNSREFIEGQFEIPEAQDEVRAIPADSAGRIGAQWRALGADRTC